MKLLQSLRLTNEYRRLFFDMLADMRRYMRHALIGWNRNKITEAQLEGRIFASYHVIEKGLGKLTPFEWVDLYSHAHSMVAGTFHGALYAMREGVRFAVLPQEAINTKLKGPMAITGLHNHICDNADNLADILEHTPDKQCIDARIEAARLDSLSFLQNALFS